MRNPLKIEKAAPADTREICAMVRDLADYECLLDTVTMTEEMLAEALFGPLPAAKALLARFQGETAGFVLYYPTFSTFTGRRGIWMEDLYVKPPFRGRGIGSSLLRRVAAEAAGERCGRLEWSALNWNRPAIRLYTRIGARSLTGWSIYRLEGDEIEAASSPVRGLWKEG